MEKGGCLRRSNQGEGRAGRTHALGRNASRACAAKRKRQILCDALDGAGARRTGEQLQLDGKGAKLETVSRSDAPGAGTGAKRGLCRRGREYRLRDGRTSAD